MKLSSGSDSDQETNVPLSPPVQIINEKVTKKRMNLIQSIIELADDDPITAIATLLDTQRLLKIKTHLEQFEPTWNEAIRPAVTIAFHFYNFITVSLTSLQIVGRHLAKPGMEEMFRKKIIQAHGIYEHNQHTHTKPQMIEPTNITKPPTLINIETLTDIVSSEALEPSLREELKSWLAHKQSSPAKPPESANLQDSNALEDNSLEQLPQISENDEVGNEDIEMDNEMDTQPCETTIKTAGSSKSLAIEEGHIQTIITGSMHWTDPVTHKELLEHQTFTRLLKKFIDYEEINLDGAIDLKNLINTSIESEESLKSFQEDFRSSSVKARVFQNFDRYLERKLGLLPTIQRMNQAAAGAFVDAAERSYNARGTLIDKRARFIKKQIDESIDVEMPLTDSQRKTFSRYKLSYLLQEKFGEILWLDRRFVSSLEDLPGGQAKINRLVRVLNILGIEEKWAAANEKLRAGTQPTCIEIGLEQLKSQLTTLFYVSDQEMADRQNDQISSRTRKKSLRNVVIGRPLTPPSDH